MVDCAQTLSAVFYPRLALRQVRSIFVAAKSVIHTNEHDVIQPDQRKPATN
eukprot:m.429504 g.429504  ORF g.429504 m.429504 type:complete len:51 (+) comp17013_c0_seq1:1630-1782(+)